MPPICHVLYLCRFTTATDDNKARPSEALKAVQVSQNAHQYRAVISYCSYALLPLLVVAATKGVESMVVFLGLHFRKVAQPVEHAEK